MKISKTTQKILIAALFAAVMPASSAWACEASPAPLEDDRQKIKRDRENKRGERFEGRDRGPRRSDEARGERKRGDGSWGWRGRKELSESDIKHALEVLREIHPELQSRLEQARKKYPDKYKMIARSHIMRNWHKIGPMIKDKKADPKLYQLRVNEFIVSKKVERSAMQIAHQKSFDGEKIPTQDQLRQLIKQRFELRAQIQRYVLNRDAKNKSQLIERDLKRTLEHAKKRSGQMRDWMNRMKKERDKRNKKDAEKKVKSKKSRDKEKKKDKS